MQNGVPSVPAIKLGRSVLSVYSFLTMYACSIYRDWCEGISDTAGLSLAVKGITVAERCSIRSALLSGFLYC
jgi:hypothetical protein